MAFKIVGRIPETPPTGGSSVVTVVETKPDGSIVDPVSYTLTGSVTTFEFAPTFGSSYAATQYNVSASGFRSETVATPAFVANDPTPAAPSGPIVFELINAA